jgi:hypothetical protein
MVPGSIGPVTTTLFQVPPKAADAAAPCAAISGLISRPDLDAVQVVGRVEQERGDQALVPVVPEVAVGGDVETDPYLVTDHGPHPVGVGLREVGAPQGDPDVLAAQIETVPPGSRVGAGLGGREESTDDIAELAGHCRTSTALWTELGPWTSSSLPTAHDGSRAGADHVPNRFRSG